MLLCIRSSLNMEYIELRYSDGLASNHDPQLALYPYKKKSLAEYAYTEWCQKGHTAGRSWQETLRLS